MSYINVSGLYLHRFCMLVCLLSRKLHYYSNFLNLQEFAQRLFLVVSSDKEELQVYICV